MSSAGGHSGSAGGMAGKNGGSGHERNGNTGGCSAKSDSMGAGDAPGSSFGGIGGNINGGLDKKKGPASRGAADAGGGLGVGEISSTESSHDGHAVSAGGGTGAEGKDIDGMSDAIGSNVASGSKGVNGHNDSVGSVLGNETAGGSRQNQRGPWMNGGAGGANGGYLGATSCAGGEETVGGRMNDPKGSECVSSGSIDAYGDQAVEVTERRTVLIR